MNYYRFFISNYKIILFGISLTFFSAFGQTFLLALYIPEIIAEFDISRQLYSTLYALATLTSGFTIVFAGKIIDRKQLKSFTLWVVAGLILANILAGFAFNLVMLVLAIIMWFLVGITGGANPTTTNAIYAELFGTKSLGSIRSLFTFVMVVSTALGPVVYSTLLENDYTFNFIHMASAFVIFLNIAWVIMGFKKSPVHYN